MKIANLNGAKIVETLDHSYAEGPDEEWRQRLLESLLAIFPGSRSAGFYEYQVTDVAGGCSLAITSALHTIGNEHCGMRGFAAVRASPPQMIEGLFRTTKAKTASVETGLGKAMSDDPRWLAMWKRPVVDSLGLTICDPKGRGVLFFTGLTKIIAPSAREGSLLTKLAVHLGAGHRLRAAGRSRSLAAAEAVMTPSGKILHLHETAKNKRDQLDDGRRRRDEARKTKHDAERAVAIWKGLIAGRWSLVDHFDTDGKRFLLAMKNHPKVHRHADLSPRERRTTALAAMGHRDKEIAYMLGLTTASVTSSLHRARAKLNVASRTELAAVWRAAIGART